MMYKYSNTSFCSRLKILEVSSIICSQRRIGINKSILYLDLVRNSTAFSKYTIGDTPSVNLILFLGVFWTVAPPNVFFR